MERCFTATSIQEITERANVNRGTFYLHYADKYLLADDVVRERFQQQIAHTLSPDARWDSTTIRQLSRAILSSLEEKFGHQPPTSLVFAPLFERIIQGELTALLVAWLTQTQRGEELPDRSHELIACVVSWAILGTAVQWSQEETTVSGDEMAEVITQVVMEGVARLAADPFPEQ
jgi:AcrR family transcriptional regulator